MTVAADPVEAPVTKLDEYRAKIIASEAAAEASTSERDRAFHRRASSIWRKLIHNIDETERRAALPAAKVEGNRRFFMSG